MSFYTLINSSLRVLLLGAFAFLPASSALASPPGWDSYGDVYKKGRITVVTFFSPTSESSMALLREMDGLKWSKPADVDFDVVGVLVDPKPKPAKAAKDAVRDISMPICHDQGHLVSNFGYSSSSVGMVVIVDKDGSRPYRSYSGNSTVAADVMEKLTELSRGTTKPAVKKAPVVDLEDCTNIMAIVRAAKSGSFSSLNGLGLPGSHGMGKVIPAGYTVYLTTGMRSPNTEYIKGMMESWRNRLQKCLPDFTAYQTMESVLLVMKNEHFTLPELWLADSDVELRIIQQEALDRTNIMLVVKKL